MNPIVKKDILNVLRQAAESIKSDQVFRLRELSDQVIHNASVFQDKDSITIAVTVYALSKLYKKGNDIDRTILPRILEAISFLESGEEEKYDSTVREIIKEISAKNRRTYIQEVFELAQIKKGSRMFEHGISMPQVADALGISLWDLMDYVGKTRIVDDFKYRTDSGEKLKLARKIFSNGK